MGRILTKVSAWTWAGVTVLYSGGGWPNNGARRHVRASSFAEGGRKGHGRICKGTTTRRFRTWNTQITLISNQLTNYKPINSRNVPSSNQISNALTQRPQNHSIARWPIGESSCCQQYDSNAWVICQERSHQIWGEAGQEGGTARVQWASNYSE